MPFTPQVRALLAVFVVVALAGGGAMMLVNRNRDSSGDSAIPTQPTRTVLKKERTSTPAQTTVAAKPKPKPRPAPAQPALRDRLPSAIRSALAANRVVIVALYDPNAAIDGTALREARAAAKLTGTPFVPIDVNRNAVESLNARYGVIEDPAVLVLRPPGELATRFDGFADRDTVAQAAINAVP